MWTVFSRWAGVVLLCAALGVFSVLVVKYQRKPEIFGLDKITAASGEEIEIRGRGFDQGMDGAKLLIGSSPLSSDSILEWEDDRIVAKIPRSDGTVIIKVKTPSGISNGVVLGDESRFPRIEYGPWLPGAAYIRYAEPQNLRIGELITLHGEGFGNKRGRGQIWVNSRDTALRLSTEEPNFNLYVEVDHIAEWTENTVRFWMPEGASSGNIYLQRSGTISNPFSVEIVEDTGEILQDREFRWSLRQKITIDAVSAAPQNALYLHIPFPQAGIGQDRAVTLDAYSETPYSPIDTRGNLSLYRIDNLENDESISIVRQVFVKTYLVEARVRKETPFHPSHPEIIAGLSQDKWVKPHLFAELSSNLAADKQGSWSKSKAIYGYVINQFSFDGNSKGQSVEDYMSRDSADSFGYSLLFTSIARAAGVPARPVGGILVSNDEARPWWWSEVWINGIGWIPIDSALGDSGIELPGIEGEPADYYFGALEGRHIAFSRGILDSSALQPEPRLRRAEGFYTLQGAYEEPSGNLASYRSEWFVPEVTAPRR